MASLKRNPPSGVPRPSPDKAFATVQRVRAEMDSLKNLVGNEISGVAGDQKNAARLLQVEQELKKAEAKVEKVKEKLRTASAAVLPRTQDPPPVGEHAHTALTVIKDDGRVAAVTMTGSIGSPLKRQRNALGTAPGSPLYYDDMDYLVKRVMTATKVRLMRTAPNEVTVTCEGVFVAGIWFQVSESSNVEGRNYFKQPEARGFKNKKVLEPSSVGVFAINEDPKQFSSSEFEVFKVLTERACAGIAYFWTHEQNGALAFQGLVEWLALHRTVFRDRNVAENCRLAYDLARGVYLPPCIRPFKRQLQIGLPETPVSPSRSIINFINVGMRERPPRHPRTSYLLHSKQDQSSQHQSGMTLPLSRSKDASQTRGTGVEAKR